MDSKGERPSEPCDPDCEWVSGRPLWNFKERLVFLDCSDGCLGSCLVILALPASECPLGASESGSVILGAAPDRRLARTGFPKSSSSLHQAIFFELNLHSSAGQCGDLLRILDSGFSQYLPSLVLSAEDPRSKIQDPRLPPPPSTLGGSWVLDPGSWILDLKENLPSLVWPRDDALGRSCSRRDIGPFWFRCRGCTLWLVGGCFS